MERSAPIVQWSRVAARVVASLLVLGSTVWLGKCVVRSSSADRAPQVPLPNASGTIHSGQPKKDLTGSAHRPRRNGVPAPSASATRPASVLARLDDLLAGSGGGLVAADRTGKTFDGMDPPDVPILPTAKRLYGTLEPAPEGGVGASSIAVYRLRGTIEEVADQMDRAMRAAGWQSGSTAPARERPGASVRFYERNAHDAVVYVSADAKVGAEEAPVAILVVHVLADRKDR